MAGQKSIDAYTDWDSAWLGSVEPSMTRMEDLTKKLRQTGVHARNPYEDARLANMRRRKEALGIMADGLKTAGRELFADPSTAAELAIISQPGTSIMSLLRDVPEGIAGVYEDPSDMTARSQLAIAGADIASEAAPAIAAVKGVLASQGARAAVGALLGSTFGVGATGAAVIWALQQPEVQEFLTMNPKAYEELRRSIPGEIDPSMMTP